jgi:hypothetical protein
MGPRCCLLGVLVWASACADPPLSTSDVDVTLVSARVWTGGPLRLVSSAFSAGQLVVVTVDSAVVTDTRLLSRADPDTLLVGGYWPLGRHSVRVRVGDRDLPAMTFEVFGFAGLHTQHRLVGRPLAVGQGSSKFWVGTSAGLALLDARNPGQPPTVVDSTVDVSCLWSLTPVAGGGVVVADRGCGALRARRYGTVVSEVDSGPRAAGWHHAVNGRAGVWVLVGDTVGVAVRQGDGSWRWTIHRWSARTMTRLWSSDPNPPEVSPDGRLAAVARERLDWHADLLVFDLETGDLLFRQDSAPGPAVTFSPSGDTLAAFEDGKLVLMDGRTGRRLASHSLAIPGLPWLLAWLPNGCPGLMLVDRRTWQVQGVSVGMGSDIDECDGAIALSWFAHEGWALSYWDQGDYPYVLYPFTLPRP